LRSRRSNEPLPRELSVLVSTAISQDYSRARRWLPNCMLILI
jgi:hypothetical protein